MLRRIASVPCRGSSPKGESSVAGLFHLDLIYETCRQIIEIICHSEYQALGIHDTQKTGGDRPSGCPVSRVSTASAEIEAAQAVTG
jgi:hypothetical protein